MNRNNNSNLSNDSSVGIYEILALIFIVLKLVGVIDWPWVWILSPLWIGLILTIVFIIIVAIASTLWE